MLKDYSFEAIQVMKIIAVAKRPYSPETLEQFDRRRKGVKEVLRGVRMRGRKILLVRQKAMEIINAFIRSEMPLLTLVPDKAKASKTG